jgi:hypothetical protein
MNDQPKSFTDLSLHTLNLSIALRNIARHHSEAEWEEVLSSIASNTWAIDELIERVDAIHSVLGFIAETPNGYINREALDGLDEQLETVRDFLASPWAEEALAESDRRFLDDDPDPKRERERLHRAAPKLLAMLKIAIATADPAKHKWVREAWDVIAEASGKSPPEAAQPIVIEVRGGVVQDVLNLPPGCAYEVKDYDLDAALNGKTDASHSTDQGGGRKTYRVQVIVKTLETYEVEAASEDEAEENYGEGKLVDSDDGLDNDIMAVEEA